MTRVCVLLAEGFEEIEAVTIVDVLRRAGVETMTVGVSSDRIRGAHGIELRADATLDEISQQGWAMVVLPGGIPGATNLRDDPKVQDLLRSQHAAGGQLAAICAAPIALHSAGVLAGRRATSYPGFEKDLDGVDYGTDPVVQDGTITTSRGPGTAMAFALVLVERLVGADKAATLKQGMLVD
jgi:protein deglycase